jgi:hypothetical protein
MPAVEIGVGHGLLSCACVVGICFVGVCVCVCVGGGGGVRCSAGPLLVWQGRPQICVSVLCRRSSCLRSTASALPSSRRRWCASRRSPSPRRAACSSSAAATGLPAASNLFRDRNLAKLAPEEAAQSTAERKLRGLECC